MIRIIMVEDSPTMRQLLTGILEVDAEIQVIGVAKDGRQGVEMVRKLKPDLVTMDVIMPDMDGLEATRQIMRDNPTPILIITAHADSPQLNVVYEAMKAGALDVVAKPSAQELNQEGGWEAELIQKIKLLSGVRPKPILPGSGDSSTAPITGTAANG